MAKKIRCESACGCSNQISEDTKEFEDSGLRLCLPCVLVSYQ